MLTDLTQWVTDVVESLGYVGVALLVAIENVFPPIPSEVVLGLAGFVAARGDASPYGMVVAAPIVTYGLTASASRHGLPTPPLPQVTTRSLDRRPVT